MLVIDVPGVRRFELEHLVLDLNGTLAFDGELVPGMRELLDALRPTVRATVITADQHGTAARLAEDLDIGVHVITPGGEGAQKLALVSELGPERVVAVGNGANDAEMLARAALGIGVIGPEGASAAALAAADVVVSCIEDAFGLLIEPRRLVATLRR